MLKDEVDEKIKAAREAKAARDKEYKEAHKEAIAAREKERYQANKEAIAAHKKEYREANKEAIAAREKAYREANKEAIAARGKKYKEEHKEAKAAQDKERIPCTVCGLSVRRGGMSQHQKSFKCQVFGKTVSIPVEAPFEMIKNYPWGESMDELADYFKQYGYDLKDYIR